MSIIIIKDIAKQLNSSPSTVSRALRDHTDISLPTKNCVISLSRKLDYHPDTIAQSLQTKKAKTIGVIVPEIKQSFLASAINRIEEVAYAAGYPILVCQSNETVDRELFSRGLKGGDEGQARESPANGPGV
jgi:DNA-binding LacI/PurR family transcriptional regulator